MNGASVGETADMSFRAKSDGGWSLHHEGYQLKSLRQVFVPRQQALGSLCTMNVASISETPDTRQEPSRQE